MFCRWCGRRHGRRRSVKCRQEHEQKLVDDVVEVLVGPTFDVEGDLVIDLGNDVRRVVFADAKATITDIAKAIEDQAGIPAIISNGAIVVGGVATIEPRS